MIQTVTNVFDYFARDGAGIEAEFIQLTGLVAPLERFNLILSVIVWAVIFAALTVARRRL